MKNIAVIGAGYVGLVTGAGLAHLGHRVRLGEREPVRVAALQSGEVPIYEEGLGGLLDAGRASGQISFHTSNHEAVEEAEFVFLCLPTPQGRDGRADLTFVEGAIDELATAVPADAIFVIKSTVPPGSVSRFAKRLADRGSTATIVSHPEFLREGRAVSDFLAPDRIVVGSYTPEAAERVRSLYGPEVAAVVTDPTSAEMIKYASNSYLAARLTFVNALANLCEAVGADIVDVIDGMGRDHRIGPHFLQPGPGYGGSCFPKDTEALIGVAEDAGYDFKLLKSVIEADAMQRNRVVDKIRQAAGGGLRGRRVAMWGLAFKAGTDDVRESPALRVARLLLAEGAEVVAYDPEARSDEIGSAESALEAARGADVLVVLTEWPEFSEIDLAQVRKLMRGHRVVDARNLLLPSKVRAAGFDYVGMGRPLA
ncbi:MAG TPA: UDP-glucose/GDP-mannose dehydrogenase family protein [Acidimicrobiia bacterium]|nr:UDP-glucose/GDP-mannose dehydrogenase family protein [Acidimicrobiia bacterium]